MKKPRRNKARVARKMTRNSKGRSVHKMTGSNKRVRSSRLCRADDGTEFMLMGVDGLGRPCVRCGKPATFAVIETPADGGHSLGAPLGNRWVARALCAACLPAGVVEAAAADPFPAPAAAQERFIFGTVH